MKYIQLVIFLIFSAGVYYIADNWNKEISCDPQQFTHMQVGMNDKIYTFKVADTACKMQQGIKGRMTFEGSHGIIFLFKQEETRVFRMNDVLIPLSIAFISKENIIVDIQEMHTERSDKFYFRLEKYKSEFPAKYVIEAPSGFFSSEGIRLGDRIQLR